MPISGNQIKIGVNITMKRVNLRVLVFQDQGFYIAQCLEYDIAAQAKSFPDLKKAFACTVLGQIKIQLELGQEPFFGIPKAPKCFWKEYEEKAEGLRSKQTIQARSRQMSILPQRPTPVSAQYAFV